MTREFCPIENAYAMAYGDPTPKPIEFVVYADLRPHDNLNSRPRSVCIEDNAFGDSGKGHIAQEINNTLIKNSPSGELCSYKWNGSRNAGHEIKVNGIEIALHQLPVACTQEGATAILGKGMLIHPNDLVTEISYVEKLLGSKLPGKVIIDTNASVITDLQSAYESFTNNQLEIGRGATGSGIAQGYAAWYEKRAVTIEDFISAGWKNILTKQYNFYAILMGGAGALANSEVNRLTLDGKRTKQKVGSLPEYLDQLEEARKVVVHLAEDTHSLIDNVWNQNIDTPFTFEGAQGPGLDPYLGIYPDVTASRPLGCVGIPDSTGYLVKYSEINMRLGTMKGPYMSSVGSRIHPYSLSDDMVKMYRTENKETGRSTGRDRGIYPIDLVAMKTYRDASGYNMLALTHLDSAHTNIPIEVVTKYINKTTGQIEPYRPYQWHWDMVKGRVVQLPSWNGKEAAMARSVENLPENCLRYLKFLSLVLAAPVAIATNGAELGKSIYFTK